MLTLHQFGYKKPKHPTAVDTIHFTVRPNTTDAKAIDEVCIQNTYQNRAIAFEFEPAEEWLDLGGNIGAFAVLAAACGVESVVSVEPEPENLQLLEHNIQPFPNCCSVVAGCVGVGSGVSTLHLCRTPYNKYRHSCIISKNRTEHIEATRHDFLQLVEDTGANCVKMDIEGSEIEILEAYGDKLAHLHKLVFEYTFDADPSVERFRNIISKLRESFAVVHHRKIHPDLKEYTHYPQCIQVFCINSKMAGEGASSDLIPQKQDKQDKKPGIPS